MIIERRNAARGTFMNNKAFQSLSYGVYIVSTWNEGTPAGCTANCAAQITATPATVMVSINKNNFTHDCIRKCGYFSLTVLAETSDPAIIGTFGFHTGKDYDKFAQVQWQVRDKLPVLSDGCAYVCCKVIDSMDTATHTVFLGEVIGADTLRPDPPMTYAYYHTVVKGKTAKNAPTYIAEQPEPKAKYVCKICGYVYDGETPFEQLPDDWKCPLCGAPKSMFEKR